MVWLPIFRYWNILKNENLEFPMYTLGNMDVKLKNAAPAASSDVIAVTCENCESEKTSIVQAPRAYTFTGTNDQKLLLGGAAHTYIRLKYKVTQNGQTQQLKDSVYVQPFAPNTFTINY